MSIDIKKLLEDRAGENHRLHSDYINPQFAKVLKTIGFDKNYTKAIGPYLYDDQGNEYLDFLSGYGVFGIGRNHPKIKSVLKEFIDMDTASLVQMEAPLLSGLLAEALVKRINVNGVDTVFFTNSGTESNETAIKFARCATNRPKILFLNRAFHGLSTGSLALNGGKEFREGFGDLLPGCVKVDQNNLNQLELELKNKDVAAFFFEPVQGKGVFVPDDTYLPAAQELCKKYGTLFVADEVQTGFGRTGKWFGFEHWNLSPDIISVSKSLSGGMVPVGAVLTRRWIYDKVFSRMDRCVVHSSTFAQGNLAMVCGLTTLKIMEEESLIENSRIQGEKILADLKELSKKHDWIKEARGKGLIVGIEFGKPDSLRKRVSWDMVHKMDKGLFGELIVMPLLSKHHILTQVSGHHQDIVRIIPPLVIKDEHRERFVGALDQVLEECGRITGPIWSLGKNLVKHAIANRKAAAS